MPEGEAGSRERDEMLEYGPDASELGRIWPPPEPSEVLAGNSAEAVAARKVVGSCFSWEHDGWGAFAIERSFEIAQELVHGITVRAAQDKKRSFRTGDKWWQIVEARVKLRLSESSSRTEGLLRLYGDRLVRALMDASSYPIVGGDALTAETMRHWDVDVDFVEEWPDRYFCGIAIKVGIRPPNGV